MSEGFNVIDTEKYQEQQSQRVFEYMAQDFFKRWQPEDPREAAQFSAEMFSIFRRIYMDAQKPAMDELIRVLKCLPIVYSGVKPS